MPAARARTSAAGRVVRWGVAALAIVTAGLATFSAGRSVAGGGGAPSPPRAVEVDTALIVSIDVSNSVDEHRYKLQIEGIAAAL